MNLQEFVLLKLRLALLARPASVQTTISASLKSFMIFFMIKKVV